MPAPRDGLLYLGSFGAGSIVGMRAATVALSVPIAVSGLANTGSARFLARAVSFASVVFGLSYGATTLAGVIAQHPLF
ncbi:MAG TPA: hypothetical protein VGJ98_03105 [Candidatus Eisenbacteria bacterium]|jgi:hypothetical protein